MQSNFVWLHASNRMSAPVEVTLSRFGAGHVQTEPNDNTGEMPAGRRFLDRPRAARRLM
jgi:hypothetical protein